MKNIRYSLVGAWGLGVKVVLKGEGGCTVYVCV